MTHIEKRKRQGVEVDKSGDGYMDIPEELLRKFSVDTLRFYQHFFSMYDLNKDALISANELYKVSAKLGYKMCNDDIEKVVRRWDQDKDGKLNFQEFVQAVPLRNSPEQIDACHDGMKAIRRRFREFDLDGDGVVTFDEAHAVLKKELAFTSEQSMSLFSRYDSNGDCCLNYNEFCKFYHRIDTRIEWVRLMFSEYDKDGSGSISIKECKKMLRKLKVSDAEVESLVAKHDTSGDGELQYDEFVAFLMDQNENELELQP